MISDIDGENLETERIHTKSQCGNPIFRENCKSKKFDCRSCDFYIYLFNLRNNFTLNAYGSLCLNFSESAHSTIYCTSHVLGPARSPLFYGGGVTVKNLDFYFFSHEV